MQSIKIKTISCLQDNYAFVIFNETTKHAAVVDVPDAAPIIAAVKQLGATVTDVFLTHHHPDHVNGLDELRCNLGPFRVIGAKADAKRLPKLSLQVCEGDLLELAGAEFEIFDVSGHTIGHIAAYCADLKAAFTADSLMAMGCGRLFEGTPDHMWRSLQKLRALPDDTMIYSGHEYTSGNIAFALSLGEDNPALIKRAAEIKGRRIAGRPTVPSLLAVEKATNPFLRADIISLQAAIEMENAPAKDVFAEIRRRKDVF